MHKPIKWCRDKKPLPCKFVPTVCLKVAFPGRMFQPHGRHLFEPWKSHILFVFLASCPKIWCNNTIRSEVRKMLNNLDALEPSVRYKVSHFIYTCFCHGYGMRANIFCKACYRTADAARAWQNMPTLVNVPKQNQGGSMLAGMLAHS